ncbi:Zn-dependent dipeptidase, dipeptidase homolog [Parasphingorhabdus marina DSM 22363]|uniref:Zn-dependent dipeptidase, dipeptidase homolog n=1 Tax=Parasphingorhabdus marina DSM 22363 TaxID=1123272 RepID=A0A1N6CSH2_9SPHN|nr:dipeptidase [Parasphingorhabdus marina]SIN61463.1 Zn-dependent dipeptidase, dipeptidase homolog [Parasphingorhabdus marina DSM 22363]
MKKALLSLTGLIVIAAIAWFTLSPSIFEKQTNMIDGKPLPGIRAEAQELHDSLFIVDLHSDTLLWKRKITDSVDYGHVDMKRLQQGNVGLQIFSSVTKTPKGQNYDSNSAETDNITLLAISQLQPFRTWFSLFERQMWHMTKLDRAVADSEGQLAAMAVSDNVTALRSLRQSEREQGTQPRTIGVMFSAEGLQTLEGNRENLEKFYNAGMRMAGLVHFFDNELAGSMHGEEKGGLTEFGREIVRDMEEMGMIVDIAHCSHACVADILAMARRPVVSSHGGVQAVCGVNRNLSDEEIRGVAATGGIIGLGYWDGAMCDTDPKSVAKAVLHVRDLVGIEHAALGSDFDGAVTTRFDTSGIVHVTQALMDAGLSEEEIRAVMGGNALRVLEQGLIPLLQLPEENPELDQSGESGQ